MTALRNILMLHTGGTLAMAGPGPLRPSDFEKTLMANVPELWRLAKIKFEVFSNIDSSDMHPGLWTKLAERIHEALATYDGVVVTHGTDAMCWSASALSFMLPGLKKPVVFTGSQRPLGETRNDARLNLIDATIAATCGPAEVSICFASQLFRGNRTRKVRINDYNAFESPNCLPLGTLGVDVVFERGLQSEGEPRVASALEPRVFLLKVFPGLDPSAARAILPGMKGLVVEGFGAGNFPIDGERSLLPLFDDAKERGIAVVMVSQARCNSVDLRLYASGAAALERGVISGHDMTPEAATVKLMHVLARERDPARIRSEMERDVAGELTVR